MKNIFYCFLILLLFACKAKNNNEEMAKLFEEVMAVHDEVMPKMDAIHDTKKSLAKILSTSDSTQVFAIIKKLDDADEAMMVWMEEFDSDYDKKTVEEQRTYLNTELEKIKKVKMSMLESIEEGNHLVQSKNPK
jgi:hypothetical protein